MWLKWVASHFCEQRTCTIIELHKYLHDEQFTTSCDNISLMVVGLKTQNCVKLSVLMHCTIWHNMSKFSKQKLQGNLTGKESNIWSQALKTYKTKCILSKAFLMD